ncbi:hypothetical protein JHK84_029525 [Glycine max]|nr:hypothetical protein JHK85_029930 [Glycine max]KAG5005257.1 hypothetical protein JHK86_029396 [Glycine max]KAG5153053.1 hypothetical protein JHK84_029525 [Glycine max]
MYQESCLCNIVNYIQSDVESLGHNMLKSQNPHICVLFLHLRLLPGTAARPLEIRKLESTSQRMWAMLHSGPSSGGKGHKSETGEAPIPGQLKQSVPSPGVGH